MPCLKSMSIQNLLVAVTHPSLSARSQQIHLIPSMQLAQSLRLPPQTLCPLIKKVDRVKCNFTKKSYQTIDLPKHITCELSNIIYLISCTKCNKHYVGETCRAFRSRMYEHKSSVSKDGKKPTPVSRHFSSDGHSQKHMQFSVLEWCTPKFESDSTSIRTHHWHQPICLRFYGYYPGCSGLSSHQFLFYVLYGHKTHQSSNQLKTHKVE